jgi:hypothetical protein
MTSSEDIQTNAQVLRDDAAIWDQAAVDMDGPIQAIAGLTLNGADDVTGLGSRLGIDTSYEKARSEMEAQFKQAVEYFGVMASAVREVADNYERQEAANAEGFTSTQGELGGN